MTPVSQHVTALLSLVIIPQVIYVIYLVRFT